MRLAGFYRLITIFGERLSEGTSTAPVGTLPTELASTIVTIGDRTMPLSYASDGQVNGVVPYGVNTNTNQQLLVQRAETYATPVYVDVAAAQPAIFLNDQQAMITDVQGKLIGPANPAHVGDQVVIYCAGLGVVNPPVGDGVITPASPLSATVNPVNVSIGGKQATALASLVPGFVGLYQVTATVPQGTTPGDQVPVVITIEGQTSLPVAVNVR